VTLSTGPCFPLDAYGNKMSRDYAPCHTLLYSPRSPDVDAIVARVASSSGLQLGSDIIGFSSDVEMAGFMFDGLASRQIEAAVAFNASELDLSEGNAWYALWFNSTRVPYAASHGLDPAWVSVGVPGRLMALQKDIDGAIIAEVASRLSRDAGPPASSPPTHASLGSSSGAGSSTIDVTVAGFSAYVVGFGISSGPAMAMLQVAAGTFAVCGMTLATVVVLVVRA
jgi:hypothetical protein